MDWLLSGMLILVNILLGKKIKWGWILSAINSLLWVYYALSLNPPQYGLIPASAVTFIICVLSAVKWFREDNKLVYEYKKISK